MAGRKRRLLTPDFVDTIEVPETGESWIADTKIRGFGLRVWASRQGESKAYAIRIADGKGRMVRRTYAVPYWLAHSNTFGSLLERARSWARDEINDLKGRQCLSGELSENLNSEKVIGASQNFHRLPSFEELASIKIQEKRTYRLDERNIQNIDKLFFNKIPENIRAKPIEAISAFKLVRVLRQLDHKPSQARALRGFIGEILKSAGELDAAALQLLDDTQRLYKPDYERWRVGKIDRRYSKKFFDKLFQRLRAEEYQWQQAIFVRLFFEFDVPAVVLLRSRWDNIYNDSWLPWSPGESKFKPWRRRRVDGQLKNVLRELKKRNDVMIPNSPFLFPSAKSATGHLMSFKPFWRKIAVEMGIEPKRFRILARTYQRVVLLPAVWERAFASDGPDA